MPTLISAVVPQLLSLFGGLFGIDMSSEESKLKAAEFELKAQQLLADQMKAQTDINAVEAAHDNIFVAGWRPMIGWVCGIAFAYHFILQPLLVFIYTITSGHVPPLPAFDMSTLTTVLMGMLGLGVMRSYEKTKK